MIVKVKNDLQGIIYMPINNLSFLSTEAKKQYFEALLPTKKYLAKQDMLIYIFLNNFHKISILLKFIYLMSILKYLFRFFKKITL